GPIAARISGRALHQAGLRESRPARRLARARRVSAPTPTRGIQPAAARPLFGSLRREDVVGGLGIHYIRRTKGKKQGTWHSTRSCTPGRPGEASWAPSPLPSWLEHWPLAANR